MDKKEFFLEFASRATKTAVALEKIERAFDLELVENNLSSFLNYADKVGYVLCGYTNLNDLSFECFATDFWTMIESGHATFIENNDKEITLTGWSEFYDYWVKGE